MLILAPPEIALEILRKLRVWDLLHVRAVCRDWRALACDKSLWPRYADDFTHRAIESRRPTWPWWRRAMLRHRLTQRLRAVVGCRNDNLDWVYPRVSCAAAIAYHLLSSKHDAYLVFAVDMRQPVCVVGENSQRRVTASRIWLSREHDSALVHTDNGLSTEKITLKHAQPHAHASLTAFLESIEGRGYELCWAAGWRVSATVYVNYTVIVGTYARGTAKLFKFGLFRVQN